MKLKILVQLIFTMALVGSPTSSLAHQDELNIVVEVKGEVHLKRAVWPKYQFAEIGNLLRPSDRLRLGRKASVKVLCNNLLVWNVPSGRESLVSSGCQSTANPAIKFDNNPRGPSRSPQDSTIPYIISPRDTMLLDSKVILRWNPVKGAKYYIVCIEGEKVNWAIQVTKPEVAYRGEPPLKPGIYWITVLADNGESSTSDVPVEFRILNQETALQVQSAVQQLKQQSLDPEATALALAHLYRSYGLKAGAIEVLEKVINSGSQISAVYQLLGDLYKQTGLISFAKNQYLKALKLSEAESNLEGKALAQVSLGEIEESRDQVIHWLQAAQNNYLVLGDKEQVEKLRQQLAKLQGRLP
ncbi:MAG: hypothetical protein B0A82_11435 [Alkalinema sp. CACIAM 70d]|nr:MAG: hypothetical protein B0A82_11435 [Alkalinema sp. CACIAM 70d]